MMSRKWLVALSLAVMATAAGCTCGRIDPGNVGIVVEMTGDNKGVLPQERGVGYYFYGPTTTVVEYPAFQQNYVWTNSTKEGKADDEHMECSTSEGQVARANIGVTYQIVPGKAAVVYQTYRTMELDSVTHGVLRMKVRDALGQTCRNFTVEQLYGKEGAKVMTDATALVNQWLTPFGLQVHSLSLIGRFHFNDQIEGQISQKVNATQIAETKENELRAVKADQAKVVAAAEGQAAQQIAIATGDARSRILRAEAEAKSNRLVADSLTPAIVELKRLDVQMAQVQKWGGGVPQIVTSDKGSGQILDLRSAK